jgi:simple sugar transport system ATP-binding protein
LREEAGSRELLGELDFSVRSGEIVGIAGVEGNGQSELLQILLHARVYRSRLRGEIEILGRPAYSADFSASAREIKDRGVGFVPEDRHHEGLLLGASLTENFVLGLQRGHGFDRRGWIDGTHLRSRVQSVLEEYDVRPRVQELSAGSLSGGNQQKLIIAREFEYAPKLLIAAQPTRGVDIGAIEFIHTRILKARSEGCGVLLISSELDEVLDLSDRILVIYRGKINREFSRLEADSTVLGRYMGGGAS